MSKTSRNGAERSETSQGVLEDFVPSKKSLEGSESQLCRSRLLLVEILTRFVVSQKRPWSLKLMSRLAKQES